MDGHPKRQTKGAELCGAGTEVPHGSPDSEAVRGVAAEAGVHIKRVENGFGAIDTLEKDGTCHDPYRIEYLKAHIEQMKKAVEEDGVELMGYTPWGCIDLVSFTTGELKKRYGFIYVDKNDDGTGSGKRYKKDSFFWFQNVMKANGEEL